MTPHQFLIKAAMIFGAGLAIFAIPVLAQDPSLPPPDTPVACQDPECLVGVDVTSTPHAYDSCSPSASCAIQPLPLPQVPPDGGENSKALPLPQLSDQELSSRGHPDDEFGERSDRSHQRRQVAAYKRPSQRSNHQMRTLRTGLMVWEAQRRLWLLLTAREPRCRWR